MLPTTMSAAIQIPKIKILLRPAIVIEVSIVGKPLLCQICVQPSPNDKIPKKKSTSKKILLRKQMFRGTLVITLIGTHLF